MRASSPTDRSTVTSPGSSNNTLFGPATNPSSNRYDGSPTDLKMRVDSNTCQPTMNVTVLGDDDDPPPPADFDGNGSTDIAVFRPSTRTWHITTGGSRTWGLPGDIPVPGDYNGNGTTDIAIYRPSNGQWHIAGGGGRTWGLPDDIPVPGDYNGDGTTDIAVFRPSTRTWHITTGGSRTWGLPGDIPLSAPQHIIDQPAQ